MTERYVGHGCQILTTDITPIQSLGGIVDFGFENRSQVQQEQSGDSVYPNKVYIQGFEEVLRITTTNIAQYFSIFGSAVNCIKGASGGFDFYSALWDECSNGPASGSVHRKYSLPVDGSDANLSTGLVVPISLNIEHQGNARLTFEVHFKGASDGLNSRLNASVNQALPATIADDQTRYTIGKTTIGSETFTGIKTLNIAFNARLLKQSADSHQRPDRIGLNNYAPIITLDGIDPTWIDSKAPQGGKAAAHADTEIFIRQRDDSGAGFTDNATANHIKLTAAGLLVPSTLIAAQVGQWSNAAISLFTKWDQTNVPIVISTAEAIT